ncbi:YybH family protein [Aquimarina sp. 2201CG5-10]|uniref:YybH family protein n=1 Tax=Aquimarina callyspongiae TaxID=3098150 RepID=UPI002AB4ABB1|nr:DUF4440 domain-containing protein [Aquimarina sp. 2201CG5-10]MDY8138591.1 DUF4440 domain-containing protein [Aquimarina sp. 2201CG5-10]
MKKLVFLTFLFTTTIAIAQSEYEPSDAYPFGQPNPKAPKEITDYAPLIGICDCISQTRNQDQTWADPVKMTWEFKYIMNGMAVQDQTIKEDGKNSGSIRQFIADSSKWYVHYYSSASPSTVLSVWEGNKKEDKIILYRKQKAPNGMDGFYKIKFHDISEDGFKWIGAWVTTNESFSLPTWKIECTKRKDTQKISDKDQIMAANRAFSAAYIKKDYEALSKIYTVNGKAFPNRSPIITGYKNIKKAWSGSTDYTPVEHEIISEEIVVLGDTAHDYGYYKGKNLDKNGKEITYKGKYVVIWKKANNQWKMYLDIWNSIKE